VKNADLSWRRKEEKYPPMRVERILEREKEKWERKRKTNTVKRKVI
jgi:hypothetical protein